ncbi:MAG: ABC transporter ATP-binding protein [Solirubrobacterales bacterium]|nr:ABC transporter ATP-binding protein [Solirubrobacterales bacterium]
MESDTARTVDPLIDLRGAGRHYEIGGRTLKALDEVSLTVSAGEFVVILGPSGSGKTTLLNLIGALDTPTVGSVVIAGEDLAESSRADLFALRRHRIGFIFQTFNLFPGLTALENVRFGGDIAGRSDAAEAAMGVLGRVGLGDRADHFPHELSGGEQQRVAIARALVAGNPVVLADEPTGELDFQTGVQILELLHEVTHTAGTAVLIVTHNREIARVADRIVELSSGRIESDRPNEPADMAELHW